MTFRCIASLAAVSVLAASMPSSARADQEAIKLVPSSPWRIDYSERYCGLSRDFAGPEGKQFFLELRAHDAAATTFYAAFMGNGAQVALRQESAYQWTGKDVEGIGPSSLPKRLNIDDGNLSGFVSLITLPYADDWIESIDPALSKRVREDDRAAIQAMNELVETSTSKAINSLGTIEELSINGVSSGPILLEIGPMKAPIEGMHECLADLQTTNGRNAVSISTGPQFLNEAEVGRMLRDAGIFTLMGPQSVSSIAVEIDDAGKPEDCYVLGFSPSQAYEAAVCDIFRKNARYAPARGLDGKPAPGRYATTLTHE